MGRLYRSIGGDVQCVPLFCVKRLCLYALSRHRHRFTTATIMTMANLSTLPRPKIDTLEAVAALIPDRAKRKETQNKTDNLYVSIGWRTCPDGRYCVGVPSFERPAGTVHVSSDFSKANLDEAALRAPRTQSLRGLCGMDCKINQTTSSRHYHQEISLPHRDCLNPLIHTVSSVQCCLTDRPDCPPSRKYFLTALGHEGLNNMLAAYEDKTAFAVCTFGYCAGPGQEPILFQGRTKGKVVPARGPPNFGTSGAPLRSISY